MELWPRAPGWKNVKQTKVLYAINLSEFFQNKDSDSETKSLQVLSSLTMIWLPTLAGLPHASWNSKTRPYAKLAQK